MKHRRVLVWCGLVACGAACSTPDDAGQSSPEVTADGGGSEGPAPSPSTQPSSVDDERDASVAPGDAGAGAECARSEECASGVCAEGVCAAPTYADGVKNGGETDVDCGGDATHKCALAKACKLHEDCASDTCTDRGVCVARRSCAVTQGGSTCGPDGKGDCCATAMQPGAGGKTFELDRYQVTAGRMRAMIERTGGDVRSFVATLPEGKWSQDWNAMVPSTLDEARDQLGPDYGDKRSCVVKYQGGRTYWQPPVALRSGDGTDESDYAKDVLDAKTLNCVDWYLLKALCLWDGGDLATREALLAAFTNGGTTTYPWERPGAVSAPWNISAPDPRVVHYYSYYTPNPGPVRLVDGNVSNPLDQAFWIAPPGQRPLGDNAVGIADAAGIMLPWVGDGARQFIRLASWERHPLSQTISTRTNAGYYALGGRCMR